jgi:signal peptidase I
MGQLTAALYGALFVYLGGWFAGRWSGNFALLLLILSTVTGLYWLAERFRFRPAREAAAKAYEQEVERRRQELARQGITQVDLESDKTKQILLAQPWWLDWSAGMFPVILAVFLLRSFVAEPFKIPSGSMKPTLLIGDLILVNKFHYGVRLPVVNTKVIELNQPQRGDVMVFRYPRDPSQDYIKRVIGVPGDEIRYENKQLFVNGQPVAQSPLENFYDDDDRVKRYFDQKTENLPGKPHRIIVDSMKPSMGPVPDFPGREFCQYSVPDAMMCKVPAGHYFMMGDNRDDSLDSRYWGFVPDQNIVGKAFIVWMNFGHPDRAFTRF